MNLRLIQVYCLKNQTHKLISMLTALKEILLMILLVQFSLLGIWMVRSRFRRECTLSYSRLWPELSLWSELPWLHVLFCLFHVIRPNSIRKWSKSTIQSIKSMKMGPKNLEAARFCLCRWIWIRRFRKRMYENQGVSWRKNLKEAMTEVVQSKKIERDL